MWVKFATLASNMKHLFAAPSMFPCRQHEKPVSIWSCTAKQTWFSLLSGWATVFASFGLAPSQPSHINTLCVFHSDMMRPHYVSSLFFKRAAQPTWCFASYGRDRIRKIHTSCACSPKRCSVEVIQSSGGQFSSRKLCHFHQVHPGRPSHGCCYWLIPFFLTAAASLAATARRRSPRFDGFSLRLFLRINFLFQAQNAAADSQASAELSERISCLEQEVAQHREDAGKAQSEVERLLEILRETENEKNDKEKKIHELERWDGDRQGFFFLWFLPLTIFQTLSVDS